MSRLRTLLAEAYHEARSGLTSPFTWVMFALLAGYMVLVLSHAGYLRELGAVDVARNSPFVLYLMVAGNTFWLFIAWAWVYAQPVVRDRTAQMHEMVLATPVPVSSLLGARFLGASVTALVIAASSPLAAFVIEPMAAVGLYDAGTVMPTPWGTLGWAWLCLAVPSAFGYGALFLVAAIRTRSTAGPFAVATAMVLLWMAAMVIVKGGDIDPLTAGIIDPSAYAEVEYQVLAWTPAERMTAWLEWTPALVVNRLVWGLLPLGLLPFVLVTTRREHLVLERAPRNRKFAKSVTVPPGSFSPSPNQTSWVHATLEDARWQLGLALRGPGLWVTAVLLLAMGMAGGFVHILGHARGPILPRAEIVGPLMANFQYIVLAFVILAVVGAVFRRDDAIGFSEMLDACPAPPGVRFVASVLTATILIVGFSLLPAMASTVLIAAFASSEAAWASPWIYQLTVLAPALLEIGAVVVLCHTALRSPGLAYGLSIATVFVLVVNHELDLVSYPTFEFAIPSAIEVSALTGWAPWAGLVSVSVLYKLSVSVLVMGIGYLFVVRGVESDFATRGPVAVRRLRGAAGVVLVGATVVAGASAVVQYQQYVTRGGYASSGQELADDAAWEKAWASEAAPWSVAGGSLALTVEPGRVQGTWSLADAQAAGGQLFAHVPDGFALQEATVDGATVSPRLAEDTLAVPLGDADPHDVTLRWTVMDEGWSAHGEPHWSLSQGTWMRAEHAVPRLGLDPRRILRSPRYRRNHDLPPSVPELSATATTAAYGVAPAGDWTWTVTMRTPDGDVLRKGRTEGHLEFVAWWAPRLRSHPASGLTVLAGPGFTDAAREVAEDIEQTTRALRARLPEVSPVTTVVQVPRVWGEPVMADGVLMLPEDHGWDVGPEGPGRSDRRAEIGAAIVRATLAERADLRDESGEAWLTEGIPRALALLAVGDLDGPEVATDLLSQWSQDLTLSLAASAVPVGSVGDAPPGSWAGEYAPLAALPWVGRQSPVELTETIDRLTTGRIADRLPTASLGAPRMSDLNLTSGDVQGQRWSWSDGGWAPSESHIEPWAWDGLVLDAWLSYERTPTDNGRL
ncbi:MAG: hypothetical protein AAGA48_33250 [Myxococcota bacterium]